MDIESYATIILCPAIALLDFMKAAKEANIRYSYQLLDPPGTVVPELEKDAGNPCEPDLRDFQVSIRYMFRYYDEILHLIGISAEISLSAAGLRS